MCLRPKARGGASIDSKFLITPELCSSAVKGSAAWGSFFSSCFSTSPFRPVRCDGLPRKCSDINGSEVSNPQAGHAEKERTLGRSIILLATRPSNAFCEEVEWIAVGESDLGGGASSGVFRDSLSGEFCESTNGFVSTLLVLCKSTLRFGFAEPLLLELDRLFRLLLDVTRPTAVPVTRPIMNKIVRSILTTLHSGKWEIGECFSHTSVTES